jgi:hypothetical protein
MKFRIEPELKYCPECNDEYRADIVECASCAVELLSGSQLLAMEEQKKSGRSTRPMEIQPGDELVDIRKGAVLEIKQAQALLQRKGFPSLVTGDSQSCGKGCCGTEVLLRVRRSDAEDILAIFQQEYASSTVLHEHDTSHVDAVFNPAAEEATCPACGCSFATQNRACPDCGLQFA